MKEYKITHKTKPILFACGFWGIERAQKWVDNFNPARYDDKTFRKEDLEIVEV